MANSVDGGGRFSPWQLALWGVLLVSLLGNAFFFGLVAKHGPRRADRPLAEFRSVMDPGFVWGELAPETRERVRGLVRANRDEFRAHLRALQENRAQVLHLMKSDDFDMASYRAALESTEAVHARARAGTIELFVEIMGELSPEERKALAERLEKKVVFLRSRGPGGKEDVLMLKRPFDAPLQPPGMPDGMLPEPPPEPPPAP